MTPSVPLSNDPPPRVVQNYLVEGLLQEQEDGLCSEPYLPVIGNVLYSHCVELVVL